ncbi:DUF4112 domain-containing protein [Alteromonas halophila]|uniref:DUF4112 domain-containing protein n=1 Tax=Alteromonas halophila TaxID=516698 RepID=A0A918MXC2_9ALTE|nr:DUF4112 domain-containing protein [Alteromonas halophila]GGW83513.1 hypothetical protein GCM10007391_16270 [Alteromonas halophila]
MDVKAPQELKKAQRLANVLDSAVRLPIVGIKVGLDSLVGLIPGAGDALMFLASARIIWLAKRMGVPSALTTRMIRNALMDFGLGFIPVIGDVADIFFKANQKNVRIMEKWWVAENQKRLSQATEEKLQDWESAQQ